MEYAFISDDLKQCHNFVYCKDYLQDAIYSSINDKAIKIYGFSYDRKKPLPKEKTRIAIGDKKKDLTGLIPNMVGFLNQFSEKISLDKNTATAVEPPKEFSKGVFVIEGDPTWMISPPMISLYSLLIRVGLSAPEGDFMDIIKKTIEGAIKPYQENDKRYLQSAMPGIDRILKHGYRKIFYVKAKDNYPDTLAVGTIHGVCGIVGLGNGGSSSHMPHWHKELK